MSDTQEAEEAVENLYHFRDHYFDNFGIDSAVKKNDDVKLKMQETMVIVEKLKESQADKAVYHMLKGKILNVLPQYDPVAEQHLSKAVKLDPKLVGAWNQLGECYWKKGDVPGAKNCFSGALSHSKNKISLRSISMVLRQLGTTQEERQKFVQEGVEKAKEAVQMDISDGMSWLVLGNAYLNLFFSANQSPKIMKLCMSAYTQAEKDLVARDNPDLHFNRAIAYKYQEDFQSALKGFHRAAQLDPTWNDPHDKERQLLSYLCNVSDLTATKGKLKGKKLATMLHNLKTTDLGPYNGGTYKGPKGQEITLSQCPLSSLKEDSNPERVVLGKVVCTLTWEEPVPFTFCMVDAEETCMPVNVYNIAQGSGVKIGDSVAIPEPFVQKILVNHQKVVLQYNSIRVDTPMVLVVNGRKLGLDKQAPSRLAVNVKSE